MANTLAVYRARYEDEWSRESTINQRAVNASGLATLLGSGLYFIFLELPTEPSSSWAIWSAALACLSIAIAFVAMSMIRVRVASVAFADEWREYERKLEQVAMSAGIPGDRALLKFEEFVSDKYAEAATTNARANERRAMRLFWSHSFITVAFLLSAAALFAVAAGLRETDRGVSKVEITNFPVSSHDNRQRNDSTRISCRCESCGGPAGPTRDVATTESIPARNRPIRPGSAPRKPNVYDGSGGEGPCAGDK